MNTPSKDRGLGIEGRGFLLCPRFSEFVPGPHPLMAGIAAGILAALLLHLFPAVSTAGIFIHDAVTVIGREVRLKAEARGTFFRKGGERVEFFADGKSLGTTLSGGDGEAWKYFAPARQGLLETGARSGGDEDVGRLLVLKKGAAVVAVEVIGGITENRMPPAGRPGSREAMRKILSRYPLVYLQSGSVDLATTRKWLDDNEYPGSPVLPADGALFKALTGMGLRIRAVVGSPQTLDAAAKWKPESFSFDPVAGAERLRHWRELEEKLKHKETMQ